MAAKTDATPLYPNAIPAEEKLLGALLMDPARLDEAWTEEHGRLQPADFFVQRYRWVYEALLSLTRRQEDIDIVTVEEELRRAGRHQEAGGSDGSALALLTRLTFDLPLLPSVPGYTLLIQRKAYRRRLIEAAQGLAALAADGTSDDAALPGTVAEILLRTQPVGAQNTLLRGVDSDTFYEEMEAARGPDHRLYRLPWSALSQQIPHLPGGTLAVVSAFAGHGKTAFLETWAEYLAAEQRFQVLYVHSEITLEGMLTRRLARWSQVPFSRLMLPLEQQTAAEKSAKHLAQRQIEPWRERIDFWYTDGAKYDEILLKIQQEIEHGAQAVFLDYFQDTIDVMAVDRNNAFITGLRRLAERHGVLLVVASQLKPTMGQPEIYASKYLHFKATLHLQLQREKLKEPLTLGGTTYAAGQTSPEVAVEISKSTNTGTETTRMWFDGPRYCFRDIYTIDQAIDDRWAQEQAPDQIPF